MRRGRGWGVGGVEREGEEREATVRRGIWRELGRVRGKSEEQKSVCGGGGLDRMDIGKGKVVAGIPLCCITLINHTPCTELNDSSSISQ